MIYTENGVKAQNPRKSRKNVTRKWREKPKIRVTPKKILRGNERKTENLLNRKTVPVLRALGEQKKNERGGNEPSPIFMTKKKPVRCPDKGRRHRSFYVNKQPRIMQEAHAMRHMPCEAARAAQLAP